MDRSLKQLQTDLISSAKKGYPFLLSGSIAFLLFTYLPLIFPMDTDYLIWIFGSIVIFLIGIYLVSH
ncbi:hypothetical protein J2Y03_000963 [Neobacillus niacini]|nr:hypothetical protein [Neobacillus niacini]MDR7075975.1 hypothetical protein [Neobacillus niacini]